MKHGKKPTVRQAKILQAHGLKPENWLICGADFVGTILIAGRDGDEFADLPCSWKEMKQLFPELWRGE